MSRRNRDQLDREEQRLDNEGPLDPQEQEESAEAPAEPEEPADGPESPDPFDLESLSLGDDYADGIFEDDGGLAALPVTKPRRDWWVRTHPEHHLNVRLLEVKDGPDRGYCLVTRPLWEVLTAADLNLRPVRLTLAYSRESGPFIWPLKLPEMDSRKDDWTASALRIAQRGENSWVKIYARPGGNSYSFKEARASLPEPPWPDKTFRELIDLAFDGKKIADRNDPLVRRLLGEE
jgi:hypothetical protein